MNDKFNLHMKVFIYLLMLKINIKCLIIFVILKGYIYYAKLVNKMK